MTRRPIRWFGLALGLATLAAGCQQRTPVEPADPAVEAALALEALATEANQVGDADAADGFSSGALALRLGIRPTAIRVTVRGMEVEYQALVTALVRRLSTGTRVVYRHLIAWTPGDRRPAAILQVSQLTDDAAFGFPSRIASAADPRGGARGTWANQALGEVWVATAGSSRVTLSSAGGSCPGSLPQLPATTCVHARFDFRVSGGFQQLARRDSRAPEPAVLLQIATQANGVNGALIAPVGDAGN